MKDFLINVLVRIVLGYLAIIFLSYRFDGIYKYLVYLSSSHPLFIMTTIFLVLTNIESGLNWIKINLQLKGVGGKSRYQAKSLNKVE